MTRSDPDPTPIIHLVGAFYWLPTRTSSGPPSWDLLTCHDLALSDGISHREMWPSVLGHLAMAWGRDAKALKRRLGNHYYALPRGRITNLKAGYLILHDNDAPDPDWRAIVVDRFHLQGLQVRTPWDEHERTRSDDVLAFEEALEISLDLPRG